MSAGPVRWRRIEGSRPIALLGGALLDTAFGDPPNAVHPVVLVGRVAALARRLAPGGTRRRRAYGIAMALGITLACTFAAGAVERRWPRILGGRAVGGAVLLDLATSRRALMRRAGEVADALDAGDLDEARRLLAYHLVSRDTSNLDTSEVAAAAVESVAENLHDGVIAPWCVAAIGGAPAAWSYRAMNTLDSLWGYHEPFLEELGMGAARLDDVLNLVPARLSAAAICVAAAGVGGDASRAWQTWRRDASLTSSPNAGHPMAAMAGALGVVLAKHGQYELGVGGRPATAEEIRGACRIADRAVWLVLATLVAATTMAGPSR